MICIKGKIYRKGIVFVYLYISEYEDEWNETMENFFSIFKIVRNEESSIILIYNIDFIIQYWFILHLDKSVLKPGIQSFSLEIALDNDTMNLC